MERVILIPSLTVLLLVAVLTTVPTPSTAAARGKDLVETTCDKLPGFTDICLKALRSDPRSWTANLTGLATVALDQLSKKANETLALAIKLQKEQNPGSRWYRVYRLCAKWHKRVIDNDISLAVKEWAAGSSEALKKAKTAAIAPSVCLQCMPTTKNPLYPDNQEVSRLCFVAGGIIGLTIQH